MKRQDYNDFVRAMTLLKQNPNFSFEIEQEGVTTKISYSKDDSIWIKQLIINGDVFSKSLFNPVVSELVDFCHQFELNNFRKVVNEFIEQFKS